MAKFAYTPETGLNDVVFYPTSPNSEAAARQQFMSLFFQIRDYINGNELNAATIGGKALTELLLKTDAEKTYSKTSHTHADYAAKTHSHATSEVGLSWGTGGPNNGDGKPNGAIYYRIEA